jgi:hypothetical protein
MPDPVVLDAGPAHRLGETLACDLLDDVAVREHVSWFLSGGGVRPDKPPGSRPENLADRVWIGWRSARAGRTLW